MNINRTINIALKSLNKDYHEAYECINCTKDKDIKKAIWTSHAEIEKLNTPGLVQYYDGDNIMLLPFSHTLVMGSTGTGKTEVFYKNQMKVFANMPDDIKPSFQMNDVKADVATWAVPYLESHCMLL